MSLQVQTSTINTYPISNTAKDGTVYNSIELMQPVSYNVEFSPLKGGNIKDMKKTFEDAADNGQQLLIDYSQKSGRFGTTFIIYKLSVIKDGVQK